MTLMRASLDPLPAYKQRELARAVEFLHTEFEKATTSATTDWKKNERISTPSP